MMPPTVSEIAPTHEHDCDWCEYIASFPLRRPFFDDEYGRRTGVPHKWVGMADVYRTCETGKSFTKFIVRYGIEGEYATTNQPHIYVKVAWIDGKDDYA